MEDQTGRIALLEYALKEIMGRAAHANGPATFKLEKSVALSDIREMAENALLGKPIDNDARFRLKYWMDYVADSARKSGSS